MVSIWEFVLGWNKEEYSMLKVEDILREDFDWKCKRFVKMNLMH